MPRGGRSKVSSGVRAPLRDNESKSNVKKITDYFSGSLSPKVLDSNAPNNVSIINNAASAGNASPLAMAKRNLFGSPPGVVNDQASDAGSEIVYADVEELLEDGAEPEEDSASERSNCERSDSGDSLGKENEEWATSSTSIAGPVAQAQSIPSAATVQVNLGARPKERPRNNGITDDVSGSRSPRNLRSTARVTRSYTAKATTSVTTPPNSPTKMPLVSLDPKTLVGGRSPNKRSPPHSPPTPHKIKLVDERQRISQQTSSLDDDDDEEEGHKFVSLLSYPKKPSPIKVEPVVVRTSPRKFESDKQDKPIKGPKKGVQHVFNGAQVKQYLPIRRSERKPKKDQLADIGQKLKLIGGDDSCLPLSVVPIPNKNRGVVPTRKFTKGDFVVEYAGELIEQNAAEERENKYAMDISKGCYMYYFKANGKHYCIDATVETGRIGRLVNHSRQQPNLQTKVVMVQNCPRLILVAKCDIEPGTEMLYDYGDRSKESLAAHPWLAK